KVELKATSALRAFERVNTVTVTPDQGNPQEPYKFEMPKWTEMREGIAIPGIPLGGQMKDPVTGEEGGWRPGRNPTFKKWATRTSPSGSRIARNGRTASASAASTSRNFPTSSPGRAERGLTWPR